MQPDCRCRGVERREAEREGSAEGGVGGPQRGRLSGVVGSTAVPAYGDRAQLGLERERGSGAGGAAGARGRRARVSDFVRVSLRENVKCFSNRVSKESEKV